MKFFRTFFGAFYSKPLYALVKRTPHFWLGYSFWLVVLTSLFVVISFIAKLHYFVFESHDGRPAEFDQIITQIAEQMPVMTLSHHTLRTREPQAHMIYLQTEFFSAAGDKKAFITIDTTGATTAETMQTPVLITDSNVLMRRHGKIEIHPFSEFDRGQADTLIINRALIEDTATRVLHWSHEHLFKAYFSLTAVGWLGYGLLLYIMRMCMLMFVALLGMGFAICMRIPLNFRTSASLAAVSYTAVAVADCLLIFAQARGAHVGLLIAAGFVALCTAIYVTRHEPLARPQ